MFFELMDEMKLQEVATREPAGAIHEMLGTSLIPTDRPLNCRRPAAYSLLYPFRRNYLETLKRRYPRPHGRQVYIFQSTKLFHCPHSMHLDIPDSFSLVLFSNFGHLDTFYFPDPTSPHSTAVSIHLHSSRSSHQVL